MYARIEELAESFGIKHTDLMAMITVYFDDSGTHAESEIAVAACLVSNVERWGERGFAKEWAEILDCAGIRNEGFHMAEFEARRKPYDTWDEDKRGKVFTSLTDVIKKYAMCGMATAVIKQDYDRLVTGQLRQKLGNYHYTFAVESCLAYFEQWRAELRLSGAMQFNFDWMSQKSGKHEIVDLFDSIASGSAAVVFGIEPNGYAFLKRRTTLQLQAADILAWEANKYMRGFQFTGKEPRESFKSIVDEIGVRARFFDAEALAGLLEDMTAKYERIGWDDSPRGGFF